VSAKLHIALVTPFSWSIPSAVNQHIAHLALELQALGHKPVVVTSSDDPGDIARIRSLFRVSRGTVIDMLGCYSAGESCDEALLPSSESGPLLPESGIPVVPLGSSFPVRLSGGVMNLGLPLDVTSRIERLMMGAAFDLVHVHEPVAPSLSFTALREARSPVVGTFHLTPAGVVAYGLGQSVLDRFFERLDSRVVTFGSGVSMMNYLYPGRYEVIPCGTRLSVFCGRRDDAGGFGGDARSGASGTALYVYRGDARRSYRAFLRALVEDFPHDIDGVVVAMHRDSTARWVPKPTPRRLRNRVQVYEFDTETDLQSFYEQTSVVVLPYLGGEWLPMSGAEAAVCGRPAVGPDVVPTQDVLVGMPDGLTPGAVFSPDNSGSLSRAISSVLQTENNLSQEKVGPFQMKEVARRLEDVYQETLRHTSDRGGAGSNAPIAGRSMHFRGIGQDAPRRRARIAHRDHARSDWVTADLHVHSNYSKDCASTVESILSTARELGIGALAIADHNEIQGALLARELCREDCFVIVAEEVKTSEGEVIGLFIEERIPAGLTFDETLSLIKEQGGLVYVPHPFDALRTTPSYRAMVDNLHRIDVIEIYNAKVALSSFNLSAERFAAKYNVAVGAGSDAHVLQGLGTAMLHMPRFHDPSSFMASLREADIVARRKNLLYLQSLKLLQTTLDRVLPEE
jgi:predicted metal-dependent phosphoesterase TrpH/glycosyltransferase involved in cell wall biosynthesis